MRDHADCEGRHVNRCCLRTVSTHAFSHSINQKCVCIIATSENFSEAPDKYTSAQKITFSCIRSSHTRTM